MFLCFFPFFPYVDFKWAQVLFFKQLLWSLFCVICTGSPTGSEPEAGRYWEDPVWGLSHKFAIIGKFKHKVWNFLQTPHTYSFYRYFWMGWIVFGDFKCLQVPFVGSTLVPNLRCLVPLQIIQHLPLNFWACWVSKSPGWTSQIILGVHSSIKSTGTWICPWINLSLGSDQSLWWPLNESQAMGLHLDLCQRKGHWPHAGLKAPPDALLSHPVSLFMHSMVSPFWFPLTNLCFTGEEPEQGSVRSAFTKEPTINSLVHCHKTNGLF